MCRRTVANGLRRARWDDVDLSLSQVYKFLHLPDPVAALRASFPGWAKTSSGKSENKNPRKPLRDRHLTERQRESISIELQKETTVTGPVLMTAEPADREAVGYEAEIANVLEETGFKVELDNVEKKSADPETATGVEMTVKDETVRPRHASRIVGAFRRAGVAIATRINHRRRKMDTLYITVGPNGPPAPASKAKQTSADITDK